MTPRVSSMCIRKLVHIYMVPVAHFAEASYPKIANRGPSTGYMYVCDPKYFPIACDASADAASTDADAACYTRQMNPAERFHQANGHYPSSSRMALILSRGLVANPPYTLADLQSWNKVCHGCSMGKSQRLPHTSTHTGQQQFAADVIVYMDNFGRTRTASLGGNHYAAIFVARRSKYTWCFLLKTEAQMLTVMDEFLHEYYRMHGSLPSVIYSDGAGVNTSAQMKALLQKRAIAQRFSVPHQSEQNPAEVYIRVLSYIARTNLQASNRPLNLWGETLMAACYLRNRMPYSGNPGSVSPHQMEFGHPPDTSHHQQRGATVHSYLPHD